MYRIHGNLWAKGGVKMTDMAHLHSRIYFLLGLIVDYSNMMEKQTVITQLLANYGTHKNGRAIDLRTRHLTPVEVDYLKEQINENYPYGRGYDGKFHDTVVFHRQVRCLHCKRRYQVDPYKGIPEGFTCAKCDHGKFKDYGQHFHVQVKEEGDNWKIWTLPKVVLGKETR
jgi:hypothetical protein